MQRRGRSRQVSHVAIARQASEERRISPQSRLYLRATIPDLPPPPPPLTPPSPTITRSPSIRHTVSPSQPVPLPSFFDATRLSAKPDHDDRYYHSPPSPPRSLSDQVHVAYALENMHLAKILLLKLKGIEVTSDNDPRIDEVKDEDFDVCLLPDVGRRVRLEEEDETRLEELRRKQKEMILVSREEELKRENLRKCEVVWQDAKNRLREAKEHTTRRRAKEDEYRRRKEDIRGRVAEENTRLQLQRRARITQSKLYPQGVVSYTTFSELNQSPTDTSSLYDAMSIVPSDYNSLTRQILASSSPPLSPGAEIVSFKDVVHSMEGALFPIEPPPTITTTSRASSLHQSQLPLTSSLTYTSTPEGRKKRRQGQLLEGLLKVVEWEAGERRQTKGKGKSPNTNEGVLLRRGSSNTGYCAACAHAAAPSSSPSGSGISKISRASSWLSFSSTGSSSSRSSSSLSSSSSSASTAPTSPSTSTSTSPITSWLKKPNASFSSLAHADPRASPPSHHSCHRLTPVDLAHTPLGPDLSVSFTSSLPSSPASRHANRNNASRSGVKPQGGGQTLVRRMSKLVELAKGFQEAYITFSITFYDAFDDRHHPYTSSSLSQPLTRPTTKKPKPAGYRATPSDISIFIPPPSTSTSTSTSPSTSLSLCTSIQPPTAPTYIPLISPFPPPPHPKTSLPHPLPYPTFFKPIPLLSRSPLRRLGSVGWRIRPLANPVYLRLRALQNLMWERGINFDVTKRRESGGGQGNGNVGLTPLMAAGKKRICGIACEGIGRSGLGVEVRLW